MCVRWIGGPTGGVLGSHLHSVHSDWLMQPEPLIHSSITVRGYSVQFGEVDFDWSREPNCMGCIY